MTSEGFFFFIFFFGGAWRENDVPNLSGKGDV